MDEIDVTPLNEIVELGQIAPTDGRPNPWLLACVGLLAAVAAAAFMGRPAVPLAGGQLDAAAGHPTPTSMPSRAVVVLTMPAEDSRSVGNVVTVRGTSAEALGLVEATVLVAGRAIGSVALDVQSGPFTVAVPAIAPPLATEAYLVISRSDVALATRRFELLPTPGVAILRIDPLVGAGTRIAIDGVAPRHVDRVDVRLADPAGGVLATASAATVPGDGWGGAMIAASTFRAELDVPPVPGGSLLRVELSWYDRWADHRSEASLSLVVPTDRLTGALDGRG